MEQHNKCCVWFQVILERVLGITVANNAALDCDPISGTIAYPAGYVDFLHEFVFKLLVSVLLVLHS